LQKNYFYSLKKHIFCIAKHVFVEARDRNFFKINSIEDKTNFSNI